MALSGKAAKSHPEAVGPFPCERGWFISRRLYRREVTLVWRRRLYMVLRFLVCLALWACILTIKAC